ncbi:bactericidal permeability-increasing protein-like [Pelodytes ibericus]
MKLFLFLAFCFPFTDANKKDPGVKGRVTLKGLQYGLQVGLQELQSRLSSLKIPDVSGSISVPVIGPIQYSVKRLRFQKLDLSNSNLSFSPDTGIEAVVNEGQLRVTGDLKLVTKLFYASTTLEVLLYGLSLKGVLGVTSDDNGHGAVWNAGCSSHVDHVDINFHGGSGWLFSMFKREIIGPVYEAMRTQICPVFNKTIEQIEELLSNLPVVHIVDSVAALEYPLISPPLITEESVDLFVKGEFIGRSQRWDLPDHPDKLVIPEADNHMLLLALSQFTANSAGYVHYKSGILQYNITDDMIPKLSPFHLDTKSLAIFIPELLTRFSDSPPLLLHVSAHSPPVVSCQPDVLTLKTTTDIQLFAMYPDRPLIPIFQMQADMENKVDILLSEKSLGASLSLRNFSLTLIHSDAGPVKVDSMQNVLSFALKMAAMPLVNERLKNVVQISTELVHLQNPLVRVLKGYLVIVTDFEVSLRPSRKQQDEMTSPWAL